MATKYVDESSAAEAALASTMKVGSNGSGAAKAAAEAQCPIGRRSLCLEEDRFNATPLS
jgi:hypothetical protein